MRLSSFGYRDGGEGVACLTLSISLLWVPLTSSRRQTGGRIILLGNLLPPCQQCQLRLLEILWRVT